MRYSEAKKRILVLRQLRWERSHLFGGKAFGKKWTKGKYGYEKYILTETLFTKGYIDFIFYLDQAEDEAYKSFSERVGA